VKKLGLIILTLYLFCTACEKVEEYSEIPYIKYKDFIFETENIDDFINHVGFLSFEFIDGDGDIGFNENSDTVIDNEIYDVLISGYTKINGDFILTDSTYNVLLPYFAEGVYRKYLRGEMKIQIYLNPDQTNDTVRYDFQIMDRAYNLSNLESTPELIIPEAN
jgi:hypothetical protein